MSTRTIVAIDGPAGSGKSTVSQRLANDLGLAYVDTGATYRLVALRALERSIPLDDAGALASLAADTMNGCALIDGGRLHCGGRAVGDEIRTPEVSRAASIVAAHPEVRRVLVEHQRRLVPPRGAVVEGRDIGTVVWPDADVKVYLDASADVRAERREAQQGDRTALSIEVHERDERDASRAVSAMRPATDAFVIDTSSLAPEAVAARIAGLVQPPPRNRLYAIVRWVLSVLLHTLFRLEVTGAENVPRRGGAILAPNHRSLIDHFVLGALTSRHVRFMGKEELFRSSIAARLLKALGAFPVRRGRPDRASLHTCLDLLARGELVGIYPEGTRRPDARFDQLEEGFAYIALKSGVPIVPVAMSGTEAVFPTGRKLPRFPKIRVAVGEPFRIGHAGHGVLPRGRIREGTEVARIRLEAVLDTLEPR